MTEHTLPDDFRIQDASNGDRVESADGEVEYVVLVDEWTGERRTVRADAVEWNGYHEHPMVQAAVAMTAVVGFFAGALYAGGLLVESVAETTEPAEGVQIWRMTYALGLVIGMGLIAGMGAVFRYTRFSWWLYRWERYSQNRHDLKRARET